MRQAPGPAIRANLWVLEKFKEPRGLSEHTRQKLLRISPATIDRLLADERRKMRLKGRSHARAGSLRKSQIPIRTFWGSRPEGVKPPAGGFQ